MLKQKITDFDLIRNKTGETFSATVPGDITVDLYRSGMIEDPYFGLNHKDIGWIVNEDFDYLAEFNVDKKLSKNESVRLVFDGIDLFADIYLNGVLLGHAENMFLRYEYEVKNILVEGNNRLKVRMKSTINHMNSIDCKDYFGVFNVPRLFIRKAQCHFGWDWAPDICGFGIWGDVYLLGGSALRIDDINVVADKDGNVSLFSELNYNVRDLRDNFGVIKHGFAVENRGDTLKFYVSEEPFGDVYREVDVAVSGRKNFANFKFDIPELWWPLGYGEQPLYNYKVELIRDRKLIDAKCGRFAFRTVELEEKPRDEKSFNYCLKINGEKIFVKGSNWVPIECFTGTVADEKYKRLVDLAKVGNYNMLRVWGGGIYEKDIFYNLCDELGIMVWQDIMLACGDIPEEDHAWVKNTVSEVNYQIKRLRNHPSIVYWCGGNEKTGSCGLQISKGDFFVDNTLQGLVRHLDKSRPFARQSPCSFTDVGNDLESGESHYNSFERSLTDGILNYRTLVSEKIVPFLSECAVMGPNSIETNKKIYPQDKLWPINELWSDRLMDNPYAAVVMDFAHRQLYYIKEIFGEAKSLEDFTAKGMTVHAEMLRSEIEFARSNKGRTWGILNWMFTDIWPSGTWSVIDYFCEPKQAYYQMKRSYEPLLVSFTQNHDGETELIIVNDKLTCFSGKIVFGEKCFNGQTVYKNELSVKVEANSLTKIKVNCSGDFNTYLFACYTEDNEEKKTLYSSNFWRGYKFTSDYTYKFERVTEDKAKITFKANEFVKGIFISFKNNNNYIYSDNYIDLEKGDEKVITVSALHGTINEEEMSITDFAEMIK